jgi:hypothetical protein
MDIKYVLSGGNIATEGIFPKSWHGAAMDAINLRAVQKTFGHVILKDYPVTTFFAYYILYPLIKKMKPVRPLNFMSYNKIDAEKELIQRTEYKPYPS